MKFPSEEYLRMQAEAIRDEHTGVAGLVIIVVGNQDNPVLQCMKFDNIDCLHELQIALENGAEALEIVAKEFEQDHLEGELHVSPGSKTVN